MSLTIGKQVTNTPQSSPATRFPVPAFITSIVSIAKQIISKIQDFVTDRELKELQALVAKYRKDGNVETSNEALYAHVKIMAAYREQIRFEAELEELSSLYGVNIQNISEKK